MACRQTGGTKRRTVKLADVGEANTDGRLVRATDLGSWNMKINPTKLVRCRLRAHCVNSIFSLRALAARKFPYVHDFPFGRAA